MKKFFSCSIFFLASISLSFAFPVGLTLWQSPEKPTILTAPSFRIPALTRCNDGTLIAVADYRLHLSDVGATGGGMTSQIELRYRRSKDGGRTWSEQKTVCQRNENDRTDWRWAMGDASLIADRETGEVLMMAAAGSVGMGASTAANPIKTVCFRSHDNGETWDEGTEMTEYLYSLYDGKATALFITSGSMCQSKMIKTGDYYRIYAAYPVRTTNHGNGTGVIFSDDFGRTWSVLGGTDRFAEGLVYEEGKVEELPDGSVALMVRDDNGRNDAGMGKKNFCRFIYSDEASASGHWTAAVSGISGMTNATNNTLLILPARRTSDASDVYLAFVALPFHNDSTRDAVNNYGRRDVGFVFKEISSEDDYLDGQALASGWQKGLQITDKLSAYTDLVALDDYRIGLLFEDNGKQGTGLDGNKETEAYDIVFHSLTIDDITLGQYSDPQYTLPVDNIQATTNNPSADKASFDIMGRAYINRNQSSIKINQGRKTIER